MAKINKCMELLAEGQAIYAIHALSLTYEAGSQASKTWADMLLIDFEHHPFEMSKLSPPFQVSALPNGGLGIWACLLDTLMPMTRLIPR